MPQSSQLMTVILSLTAALAGCSGAPTSNTLPLAQTAVRSNNTSHEVMRAVRYVHVRCGYDGGELCGFHASGRASGLFGGSFTASGSWSYPFGGGWSFNEKFTITYGSQTISGTITGYGSTGEVRPDGGSFANSDLTYTVGSSSGRASVAISGNPDKTFREILYKP
jgi:hypothetical protein